MLVVLTCARLMGPIWWQFNCLNRRGGKEGPSKDAVTKPSFFVVLNQNEQLDQWTKSREKGKEKFKNFQNFLLKILPDKCIFRGFFRMFIVSYTRDFVTNSHVFLTGFWAKKAFFVISSSFIQGGLYFSSATIQKELS